MPATLRVALRESERQGEVVAALFRLLIFVTMLAALWGELGTAHFGSPLLAVIVVYGLASLVGLGLAYRKVFHPVIPFLFVFVDLTVLALSIGMVASMQGMSMSSALTLPMFSLAFVLLIHASLRYRPWLVIFGAVLFVGLASSLWRVSWPSTDVAMDRESTMSTMSMMNSEEWSMASGDYLIPLLFFAVGAILLFYTVQRTRRLLGRTLKDSQRVAQLSRFFSPEVATRLAVQDHQTEEVGRRENVAVMFVDIRGFSRMAETMSPEELTRFLSDFRSEVCDTVFRHGGTIDKFIGDAVLAVFGTPEPKSDDARRAVEATLSVARAMYVWNRSRAGAGAATAGIGVGTHYGPVFAGVITSGQILEHTVIGDVVNVAQRLERLTRLRDADVVLSSDLMEASGLDAAGLALVREDEVELPGHTGRINVFYGPMVEKSGTIDKLD